MRTVATSWRIWTSSSTMLRTIIRPGHRWEVGEGGRVSLGGLANLSDLIRSLFVCLLLLLTHNTCMSFILYTYMYDHTCILVYMYMLILHLRVHVLHRFFIFVHVSLSHLHLLTCSSSSYMYLHCNTCIFFFSTGGFYSSLVFIVIHVHVSIFVNVHNSSSLYM